MDNNKHKINAIEKRLSEIQKELEKPDCNVVELEKEVDMLIEERNKIKQSVEKRKDLLNQIAEMSGGKEFSNFANKNTITIEHNFTLESQEYRTAWLKNLQKRSNNMIELSALEQRALTTVSGSAGDAVPTIVVNAIIEKVHQYAPLLSKINLLKVPGMVQFAIEKSVDASKNHTENALISSDNDTLTKVTLSAYEITKLVQISKSVALMTISAFENWLTDAIAQSISAQISKIILNGSGSNEGKGIENITTWSNDVNSVEVGSSSALKAEDILKLISLLPGGYDQRAEFIMSKKTLFVDFLNLQDKGKNNLVVNEGKDYYIYGYKVNLDERVPEHEAYLGDIYSIVGNMPEDISITNAFDIDTNSYKFLGCAMFDCQPSREDAFVKLKKEA